MPLYMFILSKIFSAAMPMTATNVAISIAVVMYPTKKKTYLAVIDKKWVKVNAAI